MRTWAELGEALRHLRGGTGKMGLCCAGRRGAGGLRSTGDGVRGGRAGWGSVWLDAAG